MKTRKKNGRKHTELGKKRSIFRKSAFKMRMKLRGWMKWKPKWKPKWSVLRYILRFFAVFFIVLDVFSYLPMDSLACGGTRASSFCALRTDERLLRTFLMLFGCFLEDAFAEGFCELLFLKNDLLRFFWWKNAFTVDFTKFKKTCFLKK